MFYVLLSHDEVRALAYQSPEQRNEHEVVLAERALRAMRQASAKDYGTPDWQDAE